MIESSDTSTAHTLPSSPIYSRFSLWNNGERATWMRRRRRNISVYIDTSGSRGRGWVTHLLHHLVEEGAKVENVSTNSPIISEGGGGINLNKCGSNFFVTLILSIFVKKKSQAQFMVQTLFVPWIGLGTFFWWIYIHDTVHGKLGIVLVQIYSR